MQMEKGGLKPRFGAKSPMGCHHGYGLENLRFVTLCLVNWLCRWLSMFLSRLRGKRVFTRAEEAAAQTLYLKMWQTRNCYSPFLK